MDTGRQCLTPKEVTPCWKAPSGREPSCGCSSKLLATISNRSTAMEEEDGRELERTAFAGKRPFFNRRKKAAGQVSCIVAT